MNKKHFMSIFILGIMILSVLGIAVQYTTDGTSSIKVNGQRFQSYQNAWVTYKGDSQILITTQPDLLKNQQVPELNFKTLNKAERIYFTSNPENQLPVQALFSIQNNIFPYLKNVLVACTEDSEPCANLPLKSCKDATEDVRIIQAEISEERRTTFENNCLLIQGNQHTITQQVEAVVLKLHEII